MTPERQNVKMAAAERVKNNQAHPSRKGWKAQA